MLLAGNGTGDSDAQPKNEPIQIISSSSDAIISHLEAELKVSLTVKRGRVRIFDDFRLTRTVVAVGHQIILEIFNSSDYELIPYTEVKDTTCDCDHKHQVATPMVLMRFMLINLWTINLLMFNGYINRDVYLKKVQSISKSINKIDQLDELTPTDGNLYFGQYVSKVTAYKALIKAKQAFIPDYWPYLRDNKAT
jgi:hypothetical protein